MTSRIMAGIAICVGMIAGTPAFAQSQGNEVGLGNGGQSCALMALALDGVEGFCDFGISSVAYAGPSSLLYRDRLTDVGD